MTFTLPTSGAVGTVAFSAIIEITCRTVGGSATFAGSMRIIQASATLGLIALNATVNVGTAAAGSTLTNNYIELTFGNTGSANVACTFQQVLTEIAVT
jgi:hypothetical protein